MSGRLASKRLTPKRLILDLLLASRGKPLSAREAVRACRLFSISENNARVALARLLADQWIAASDRGSYVLADRAHRLADEVATWRTANRRVRKWTEGHYLGVMSAGGSRSSGASSGFSARKRALDMLGFRKVKPGLHIRPDNLEPDLDCLRDRLRRLGLSADATLFRMTSLEEKADAEFRGLWDASRLQKRYLYWTEKLDRWIERGRKMEADQATRNAFLIAGEAIRHVVYDPLLPEPMVDVVARANFFATVQKADEHGKRIWRDYYRATDQAACATQRADGKPENLSGRAVLR